MSKDASIVLDFSSNVKEFDCIVFKRKLHENSWTKSGAKTLAEYIDYVNEVSKENDTTTNKSVKIGDIIKFGDYKWRVLDVQDNRALIISEEILFQKPYHSTENPITWENCSLRKYLNNEFYNTFNKKEKERIYKVSNIDNHDLGKYQKQKYFQNFSITELENLKNMELYEDDDDDDYNNEVYDPYDEEIANDDYIFKASSKPEKKNIYIPLPRYGNPTQDMIFLLSITEYKKYYSKKVIGSDNNSDFEWLRSPGVTNYEAAEIYRDDVCTHTLITENNGVRPALWIIL